MEGFAGETGAVDVLEGGERILLCNIILHNNINIAVI